MGTVVAALLYVPIVDSCFSRVVTLTILSTVAVQICNSTLFCYFLKADNLLKIKPVMIRYCRCSTRQSCNVNSEKSNTEVCNLACVFVKEKKQQRRQQQEQETEIRGTKFRYS